MEKTIYIKRRDSFGVERYYVSVTKNPARIREAVRCLTQQKTVDTAILGALKDLGFEIAFTEEN